MDAIRRAELEIEEMEKAMQSAAPSAPPQGQQSFNEPPAGALQANPDEPPAGMMQSKPAEPPAGQQQNDDANFQRWKSLEGIVKSKDTQIQQLMQQNDTLLQRVEQLVEMQSRIPAQQQMSQPSEPDGLKSHLSGLVDRFGEDMLDAMAQVSEFKMTGKMKNLEDRIATLTSHLEHFQNVSQKLESMETKQADAESEAFKAKLSALVPNWQELMSDQRFEPWKQSVKMPYSSMTFAEGFAAANRDWSVEGMAGVFKAFMDAYPVKGGINDPRLSQIAPSTRGGNQPSSEGQPNRRVWTLSEIDQFYHDATRGKYSDADYARIEAEIDNANRLGLVSPG